MEFQVVCLLMSALCCLPGIPTALEIRPPRITPFKEDFVGVPHTSHLLTNATQRFRLLCEGQQPVNWTFPFLTSPEHEGNMKNLSTWKQVTNVDYPYAAHLELVNSTFEDTGNYSCSYDTSKMDVTKSSTIYIFVYDEDHLMVGDQRYYHQYEHKNVVINCRPTSPDVIVSLWKGDEKMPIGIIVPEVTEDYDYDDMLPVPVLYDPTVGFTLENVNPKQSDEYECRSELGKKKQILQFTLNVVGHIDSLPKPVIRGEKRVAEEGTLILNCTVQVGTNIFFMMHWTAFPNDYASKENRVIIENSQTGNIHDDNGFPIKIGYRVLRIVNVSMKDQGIYTCTINHLHNMNNQTALVEVVGKDISYINMSTLRPNLTTTEGTEFVQWAVDVDAFPQVVDMQWYSSDGPNRSLSSKPRFSLEYTPIHATLKIFEISIVDSGVYYLVASNNKERRTLLLKLDVKSKPAVEILPAPKSYYLYDESHEFNCSVIGYPKPDIKWGFQSCINPLNCGTSPTWPIPGNKISKEVEVDKKFVSTLNYKFEQSGYLICSANNSEGLHEDVRDIWVTDIPNGFLMDGKIQAAAAIQGDNITMNCAASKYNNSGVRWSFNDIQQPITTVKLPNVNVTTKTTPFSYQAVLTITNITNMNDGYYHCSAASLMESGMVESAHVKIEVRALQKPNIISKDMDGSTVETTTEERVEWTCHTTGVPTPKIRWFKDGKLMNVDGNHRIYKLSQGNQTLIIKFQSEKTEGEYACEAWNRAGHDRRYKTLKFSGSGLSVEITVTMVIFVLIVIGLIAVLLIKMRREQKLRRELEVAGLAHFEEGALDCLNPDLPIDDQAELLPYDKKWEFPRENLKLGKQLGAGAFGIVMKAEATGMIEGEAVTTVAVKMVKRNAEYSYIKALASELKIMVHLGKHLNVVNLLGACTKNLAKRELLVIVEYCRFGNLHNYLLRHRGDFIDQVDPVTGEIDPSVGADILARHESVNSQSSNSGEMTVDYRASGSSSSSGDNMATICMTPTGEEGCTLSNNSIQPEWRSNYRGDYKGKVRPICTRDLLCWAFQVARGMEYLAGRKVLHGDLAARNILLADNNVVKICDFGLAKSMYKTDNYRKKGDGPLPVKWMAIESIRDRIFSTQSDVWSFGIVLWEFFSLARTPYPGMEADEKLYTKLVEGYRMDKPEFATKEVYDTIEECWLTNPNDRPTFSELVEQLGNMLEETVRMHYIDLNGPYMDMNTMWKTSAQSDYLAMMSAPTYGNLVSPDADDDSHEYVNSPVRVDAPSETGESSGYLCMKSPDAVIFSPRPNNNPGVFSFKVRNDSHGGAVTEELRPMLSGGRAGSDSDNDYKSPGSPQVVNNLNKDTKSNDTSKDNEDKTKQNFAPSFSNPSYQTMNPIINATPDNYVNMPQQKIISGSKPDQKISDLPDAFSNPNYLSMGKVQDIVDNSDHSVKGTDNEHYLNLPGHGHNLSNAPGGFQSDLGESPYVN